MSGRASDRELQILGGPESHLLARFDLDGLSGRRVPAHAGCARAYLQDAEARNPDPLTFLEVLGDQAHKIAEDRLPRAFRELMILGQPCRQMLQRNGASFGSSRWCFRFAWARNRHDGLPSSEARKCAAVRDMIRGPMESVFPQIGLSSARGALQHEVREGFHGIGGTLRNRSGN